MIKLVACDLDGTLFNSKIDISTENVNAIKIAQENGIEFLVATGRSPQQSRQTMHKYGLQTGFININGALVYDAAGHLQVKHALPPTKAIQIAAILEKYHLYYEIVTAEQIYSKDISQRIVNLARSLMKINAKLSFKKSVAIAAGSNAMLSMKFVPSFKHLFADPQIEVMKIISFDVRGQRAFHYAKQEITALGKLAVTSSGPVNIEINDAAAQKGPALLDYARQKGLKRAEVAAIGDNLNDLSMIQAAGIGVAMGNAIPEIKKAAQVTTKSNDDNGVGYILRKFISANAKE